MSKVKVAFSSSDASKSDQIRQKSKSANILTHPFFTLDCFYSGYRPSIHQWQNLLKQYDLALSWPLTSDTSKFFPINKSYFWPPLAQLWGFRSYPSFYGFWSNWVISINQGSFEELIILSLGKCSCALRAGPQAPSILNEPRTDLPKCHFFKPSGMLGTTPLIG